MCEYILPLLFLHKQDFGSTLKEQEPARSDESKTFVCENWSAVLVNVWKQIQSLILVMVKGNRWQICCSDAGSMKTVVQVIRCQGGYACPQLPFTLFFSWVL